MDLGNAIAEQLETGGWTVDHEALTALDGDLRVDEPEALDALMNPFRIKLLTSLSRNPASVKELSERFDVPATRLYHHIGLLEEYGAVRIVGNRRSGARTERCYGAMRGGITPSSGLLQNHADVMADSVVKIAALAGEAFAAALRSGRITLDEGGSKEGLFTWLAPRLTAEQRIEIDKELTDLTKRVSELSQQNTSNGVDCEPTILFMLSTPDVTVPS